MSVPAAIEQVLTQNNITYGITESSNQFALSTKPNAVKTSLLEDSNGKVQVLLGADSILDIDAVGALTNRQLKPTSCNDIETICGQLQLERLPTVPKALNYDLIVDQRLLELVQLELDSGSEQNVIDLEIQQFKQLISEAVVGPIAIAEKTLQTAALDEIDDVEDISKAIANFTQLRIKQRLEETLEFPPLPDTAQRIIKLRVNPNADIKDLTDIVESDPSLAAQVVSWAASPYYAAPGKINSVHDAIVRVLGFDLVLNLALGLALGKSMSLPKDSAEGFTPYWQQAVYTATAVEALVGVIPPKERPSMGLSYLSGLLHNFGYIILAQVFPPHFSNICRYQEANPYSNHALIERHLLGVTREQLGGWLMKLWNMPDEISTAIRFQNEITYENEGATYAHLLFVASRLLRKQGIGDAPLTIIPDSIYQQLHLDPEKAEKAINQVMESATELDLMASNMAG
jgi:HD-like signal output (HDOD) protein/prolyl-tRNA editing enzyme YbaK/EbsC (Cys-tRNA(Pro) deacylase)